MSSADNDLPIGTQEMEQSSNMQDTPSVSHSLQALRDERERTRMERNTQLKRRRTQLNKKLSPDLIQSIPALMQVITDTPSPSTSPPLSTHLSPTPPSRRAVDDQRTEREDTKEKDSTRHHKSNKGRHKTDNETSPHNARSSDRKEKTKEKSTDNNKDKTRDQATTRTQTSTSSTLSSSAVYKNDYSQHFVDTNQRPQNFIRDSDLNDRFEEYPKLKELIQLKDKEIQDRTTPLMYMKVDLKTCDLAATLGCKFDVILIDPPWEEYRRRDPALASPTTVYRASEVRVWTLEEMMQLKIDQIAASPAFLWLWVGSAEGLVQGRLLLKKWGFRRCEDICWLKTNKHGQQSTHMFQQDLRSAFQHTKEHCLMGIRGTVRRNQDSHFIHANIDTDVIISEEPPLGSTEKPVELYHIIEHFCLGRRRLELFGRDHNIRPGSNYSAASYTSYFQGDEGHLLTSTPDIENLRPKSPTRNNSRPNNNPPTAYPPSSSSSASSSYRPPSHHTAHPSSSRDYSSSRYSHPFT